MPGCDGSGCGVAYELTPVNGRWTETVLYSFTGGNDGGIPRGAVTFDQVGNLFGVAEQFGSDKRGTVYELSPSGSGWTENTVYDFETSHARFPSGEIIFDQIGNLYGHAFDAGNDGGFAYELTELSGTWTLASSLFLELEVPFSLALDSAGNIYGAAASYKGSDCGYVFKTDTTLSTFTVLYKFTGSNGQGPEGCDPESLALDANGDLYGTASGGAYGYGVIWEIAP